MSTHSKHKGFKAYGAKKTKPKASKGFKAYQKEISKKQGVGMERAGAILAAGARKASPKAIKANPRLKKVAGVKKKGK